MATKSNCLPHLLVEKLLKHGNKHMEKNNNYLFSAPSSSSNSSAAVNAIVKRKRGQQQQRYRSGVSQVGRRGLRSIPRPGYSLIVAAVAVVVYMNSLSGDFVHDDVVAIRRNADVVGPSTDLWRIFTNDFWGKPIRDATSHKSYRPLCVLSFR